MLSLNGWVAGLSGSIILISGIIIGLYCIYQAKKTNTTLLFITGLFIIFMGFLYLGVICDFLTILLTGKNFDNSHGLIGILGYMWVPPAAMCGGYMSSELLYPRLKWYLMAIFGVLAIIFELFLFLDPFGSFNFIEPSTPGEDLIDDPQVVGSPVFILFFVFLIYGVVCVGLGFLIKSIQSTGVIRKKFLYLSLGFLIFLIIGTLDQFPMSGPVLFLVRTSTVSSFWLWYLGLKEEPAEKLSYEKKVHIEGGIFPISEYRREDLTEEEVSISKEKQICLVCKGSVFRFNIYLCPMCRTFYCAKCAHALTDLENMCWVCEMPFDKSKPSKPFEKAEEEIDIEISEKNQKKPKKDKKPS